MRSGVRALSGVVPAALVLAGACAPLVGTYEVVELEGVATQTCATDDDCDLFLACATPPGATVGLCTAGCNRCDDDTVCVNGRCFLPCELAADCPAGLQCLDLGDEQACVPAEWGSGTGTCSVLDPLPCGGLECVAPATYDYDFEETGVGLCVAGCTAGLCPSGSHCASIGTGERCVLSCAPMDGSCPAGLHCVVSEFEPPACLPVAWLGALGTSSCTSSCGPVDCATLEDQYTGVCAETCSAGLSCSPGKLCISGPGLEPHCLVDCAADPLLCDPLFCLALDDGARICAPDSWQ